MAKVDAGGMSMPLSPTDLGVAERFNFAEIRAYGLQNGTWRVWRARRPPGGWNGVKEYMGKEWPETKALAVEQYNPDTMNIGQFSSRSLDQFLRQASKDLGFVYEVHTYG